jgi:hypothetical protein
MSDDFDATRAASSLDALASLCQLLPEGYAPAVSQNVNTLRSDLHAANEQIAQLVRALRAEIERPIFMGEPITSGAAPAPADPDAWRCLKHGECFGGKCGYDEP